MAEDADKNNTITYTLDGRYEITELVHLDSDSGDLIVANRIDHEVYDWFNFTVGNVRLHKINLRF
jgi:cadherin 23